MSRYLLVPGDPESTPDLVVRACALAVADGAASFALVVPRPGSLRDRPAAEHVGSAHEIVVSTQLTQAGIHAERRGVGDASVVLAVEDEVRARPGAYDTVVLAARVPRWRRLLALDVHARANRLPLPVMHVYAGASDDPPAPLVWRVGGQLSRAAEPIRALARLVEDHRQLGTALIVLPMLVYLCIGLGLAIFVNRRFFLTDAVALCIDLVLVVALLLAERAERRQLRRRLLIEEATDGPRAPAARLR